MIWVYASNPVDGVAAVMVAKGVEKEAAGAGESYPAPLVALVSLLWLPIFVVALPWTVYKLVRR